MKKEYTEKEVNKKLMTNMWVLIISSMIYYIGIILLAAYTLGESLLLGIIVCFYTVMLVFICFYVLKVEVEAGYYECGKCHHRYVPSFKTAVLAMHIGTTRYMKCPKCEKKAWAKKVLTKD